MMNEIRFFFGNRGYDGEALVGWWYVGSTAHPWKIFGRMGVWRISLLEDLLVSRDYDSLG